MRHTVLADDGSRVTVDVHGFSVDDALRIVRSALRLAAEYGRTDVRVIHGSSTSGLPDAKRTIRSALHAALEDGEFDQWISGSWRQEDSLTMSLPLGRPAKTARLSGLDLDL